MPTAQEFRSDLKPVWCPGCGDYGVLAAAYQAFAQLGLDPDHTVVVSGIGCSGRFPGFVNTYGFHAVHGRALPIAMGIKEANPALEVVVAGGDGDGFSIGGGHILHMARRNVDLCYIVMDNNIYGLTKGQTSPTSPAGLVGHSVSFGSVEDDINPMALCVAWGVSFAARGFSARPRELAGLIAAGIAHRGFALIQALSPCVTFHDTFDDWKGRVADIPAGHDPTDPVAAFRLASARDPVYLGLFYRRETPTFTERLGQLRQNLVARHGGGDLGRLLARYR